MMKNFFDYPAMFWLKINKLLYFCFNFLPATLKAIPNIDRLVISTMYYI